VSSPHGHVGKAVTVAEIAPPPAPRSSEKVDHPAHYGGRDNPYEAIKVIRAWGVGFAVGNALKYLARAGKKGGESTLDDLRKARWYLDNEIEALEAEKMMREARGDR
jgi:hypothetical protein